METNPAHAGPKDVFLWLGAMVALYASAVSFITLYFQYINTMYPNVLDYSYDPYSGTIKFAIASLIVLFPLFLGLMYVIRRDISAHAEKSEIWVRRWVLFLTLFVAGITVASDLVTLVYYFLEGDITMRFVLKVAIVLLVAGGGFLHFLADIKGYWNLHPNYAKYIGFAVAGLIALSIAAGFLIIGSPMDARKYKFDDQKVMDLQNIQWQVLNYYQTTGKLPAALGEIQDPLTGYIVPVDPETGAAYSYKTDNLAFQLCATFNMESRPTNYTAPRPVSMPEKGVDGDLAMSPWNHGTGEMCFDREIDPERYPIFKK